MSGISVPRMSNLARTPPNPKEICRICGADADGVHFRVTSCRACAMFFRRWAMDGSKQVCRRATYNCDVSKDTFQQCRRCRFQKCKDAGMSLSRRKYCQAEKPSVRNHSTPEVPKPQEVHNPLPRGRSENHRVKCNTNVLRHRIAKILNNSFYEPSPYKDSLMKALIDAYNKMVPHLEVANVQLVSEFDVDDCMRFCYEQIERIAVWAMRCEEFTQLPLQDKWKIYRNFWPVFEIIERCSRTMEEFGFDGHPNLYLVTDDKAVDLATVRYISTEMEPEKLATAETYYKQWELTLLRSFVLPAKELNLTTFEVVYLSAYKLWDIDGLESLDNKTYRIAEKLMSRLNQELHNYYRRELRIENYASRLSKMVKLLTEIEGCVRMRRNIEIAIDVFQLFGTDLADSDFFLENET
ncbi:hypothetical protein QR680_006044 [Steinernema hermaphroditum]|uniref:Nuclear receptor domain-containing protein n=1 Tax=Steinernema hermaphroditum TaxID=289476 RepID=A0AA39HWH9_9BILA|nr:hypothetical protein QR680_006044 [Steinernema hermaphroditum]